MKNLSRDLSPIQRLWNRHYIPTETGSYSGDMGRAYRRMLADPACTPEIARKLHAAAAVHRHIRNADFVLHFETELTPQ